MLLNIIIKIEIVIIILLLLLNYLCFTNNIVFLLFLKNILCKFGVLDRQNEILNNLWLGDYNASKNIKFITQKNICLIVNISKDLSFLKTDRTQKIRIAINDDKSSISNKILVTEFENIYDIVKKNIENKKGVLIHCNQGVQRSAAFVVLFLMKYKNFSNKQSIKFIKTKSPTIFYNGCNFKESLSL